MKQTPATEEAVERLHPMTGPLVELRKVIHPLTQQGEDRIWRAAEKACKLIDQAEDEREMLRRAALKARSQASE